MKKIDISDVKLLFPWKGKNIYHDSSLFVCSLCHMKQTQMFLDYFERHWETAYRTSLWGTVFYFTLFLLLPHLKDWIFLFFTLDWGIGLWIYPCFSTEPGKGFGLYKSIIIARIVALIIATTGILKFCQSII